MFGLSYAIASLGCELPLFLVQVSNTFGHNVLDGLFPPLACVVGSWPAGFGSLRGKPKWLPVHPGGHRRGEDRTGEFA